MPPTTIKLPDELKKRVAALVEGTHMSMHAFFLQAIEERASITERSRAFFAEAREARAEMLETGKGYAAEEVSQFIRAKLAGKKAARPKAKSWRK